MKQIRRALRLLLSTQALLLGLFLTSSFFIMIQFIDKETSIDNVTWIYSSSMQTLAALIALLPISYGYYINNIDTTITEEFDSYITDRLKQDVYIEMMTVIFVTLIVIILNLVSFFVAYHIYISLVIGLLTILCIGLISLYIYRLFAPNKVKFILKEFDQSTIDPDQKKVSLDQFITDYLELERQVKDYISNENDNEQIEGVPLYDIVDQYSKDFDDLNEHYADFKEIIFHRNNVIHNYTDMVVDYQKYSKMQELTDLFERLNDQFVQRKIFGNIATVRQLVEQSIQEYLLEENKQLDKDEFKSVLHNYFVGDYYTTISDEDNQEVDFEVIQNNFSERKLVGIEVKTIPSKTSYSFVDSFFKRLKTRYKYLFFVNYDQTNNSFTIYYHTKDNKRRSIVIR